MNDSKISVRYSRALFQSAVEKNLLDKVYQDMIFIAELCRIDEVKEVLNSPIITPSKKKVILTGQELHLQVHFILAILSQRRA